MNGSRAEKVARIRELRAAGMNGPAIAAALGMKHGTVRNLLHDPDGAKQRERRLGYQGTCASCGGPTDGSNGAAAAPTVCLPCLQGVAPQDRVTPSMASSRRKLPVRLSDLPLQVRLEGARAAARWEQGEPERREILFAAIFPSDRVYWVADTAADRVDELMRAAA